MSHSASCGWVRVPVGASGSADATTLCEFGGPVACACVTSSIASWCLYGSVEWLGTRKLEDAELGLL